MVVCAVAVDMQDVWSVFGIRDEVLGYKTVHLEVLTSYAHSSVAFAVEGGYLLPCRYWGVGTACGEHTAVVAYIIIGVPYLQELHESDLGDHTFKVFIPRW